MRKPQWVIFREDSNTHKEIYLKSYAFRTKKAITTAKLDDALRFDEASDAYEYATECGLAYWRVGIR